MVRPAVMKTQLILKMERAKKDQIRFRLRIRTFARDRSLWETGWSCSAKSGMGPSLFNAFILTLMVSEGRETPYFRFLPKNCNFAGFMRSIFFAFTVLV